jgi:hypothetical protein
MEQFTFENFFAVVFVLGRIILALGACALFSHLITRWWEEDEKHRERIAPLKARILRRQREAAKEKTSK